MLSLRLCTHPKIPSQYYYKHIVVNKKKTTFSSFTNDFTTQNSRKINGTITNISLINSSPFRFRLAAANDYTGEESVKDIEEKLSAMELPEGLEAELMPKHVAVMMDGNGRWARSKMLTLDQGNRAGAKAIRELAVTCSNFGVKVLTAFVFSTENWGRPKEEVDWLMNLFHERAEADLHEIMRNDLQVSMIGDRSKLPQTLQLSISYAEEYTKANKGMRLVVAVNYGGRYDITQASRRIATKVRDGILQVEEINEDLFEQHLQTSGIEYSNPDLLIRTSGESRVSNFLLWQLAYSELYFAKKFFPDFGQDDFVEALNVYQKRHRRYGGGHK